ncbi:Alkaline shock protein [Lachnospiraceae bacterium TWA4]|nr:Alkaline shock protein [Lachnospiraceae bacterium TWA4]
MAKDFSDRSTHMIHETKDIGSVEIADEVVAVIAGLAATEVEGVASMAGNITKELVGRLGAKNLSKGVKIRMMDTSVSVDIAINVKYGYSIPEVAGVVQERVKNAIESMTGLEALDINVKISNVELEPTGATK